jgi:tRNA(fMet)-specific endonuclease VapC
VSVFILDTDHLSLYERGNPQTLRNIVLRVSDVIAVSVITIEEQLEGWQRALRQAKQDAQRDHVYRRMARTVECLAGWPVLPYTVNAMQRRGLLLRMKLNVGSNDLKIAAIALDCPATVVTRNARDFGRVPGLAYVDSSI